LFRAQPQIASEEEILRWLAAEYGLGYTTLEDAEPDRQLLSLFPARILLKEELLPLQRTKFTHWAPAAGPFRDPTEREPVERGP